MQESGLCAFFDDRMNDEGERRLWFAGHKIEDMDDAENNEAMVQVLEKTRSAAQAVVDDRRACPNGFTILLGIFSIEYWGQCTYFIVPGLRSGLYRIETLDKPAPRKQYGFHFFFKEMLWHGIDSIVMRCDETFRKESPFIAFQFDRHTWPL